MVGDSADFLDSQLPNIIGVQELNNLISSLNCKASCTKITLDLFFHDLEQEANSDNLFDL